MTLLALIALHDFDFSQTAKDTAERVSYQVFFPESSTHLVELAREKPFNRILMELNYGDSGNPDVSIAQEVYGLVKERHEEGSMKFLGITGTQRAYRAAKKLGIPVPIRYQLGGANLRDFFGN